MKTGILGGSFSPPHKGHLHAAVMAREALSLDRLILIPAGDPPHKVLPEGTPDGVHRLNMTRLAACSIGAEVLDIEIKRQGKSFTADTLTYLQECYPEDTFYFIMGTDMLLTLDKWYRPDVIFKLAVIVAVARNDGDVAKIEKKAEELSELGAEIEVIKCEAYAASSTEIREDFYKNCDLLTPEVKDYILRENLYGIKG